VTSKPRKRAARKAVSAPEPTSPATEAVASEGEVQHADADQEVAAASASETDESPPGVEQQDSLVADVVGTTPRQQAFPDPCVKCDKPSVWKSDGKAHASRAYCQRHLPANITRAMVESYRVHQLQ
jgi:hypothetical protein